MRGYPMGERVENIFEGAGSSGEKKTIEAGAPSDRFAVLEGVGREGRASEFSIPAAGAEYTRRLHELMEMDRDWTALDIGAASGGLGLPLAGKIRRVDVTGLTRAMEELTRKQCVEQGTENLSFHSLKEAKPGQDRLGTYDVVIVSGAKLGHSLPWSVIDIDGAAQKKVFVVTAVGDGPFDRAVYEATGRSLDMGPSFSFLYYEVIHRHLDMLPNIAFVKEEMPTGWKNREEALESHRWMFMGLTAREEERIRHYMDRNLVREEGLWKLPYEREAKWAVIWWEKKMEQGQRRRRAKSITSPGARFERTVAGSAE